MIKITPRKIAIGIAVVLLVAGLVAILVIAPPVSPVLAGILAIGAIVAEEGLKILVEKAQAKYEKWKARKDGKKNTDDDRPHFERYESVHLDMPNGMHFSKRKYSNSDYECEDEEEMSHPLKNDKLTQSFAAKLKKRVKF